MPEIMLEIEKQITIDVLCDKGHGHHDADVVWDRDASILTLRPCKECMMDELELLYEIGDRFTVEEKATIRAFIDTIKHHWDWDK